MTDLPTDRPPDSPSVEHPAIYKALVSLISFVLPLPQRVTGSGVLETATVALQEPTVPTSFQLPVLSNQTGLAMV